MTPRSPAKCTCTDCAHSKHSTRHTVAAVLALLLVASLIIAKIMELF